jgi:hypothetical protein
MAKFFGKDYRFIRISKKEEILNCRIVIIANNLVSLDSQKNLHICESFHRTRIPYGTQSHRTRYLFIVTQLNTIRDKVILNTGIIKKDYKKNQLIAKKPYHYLILNVFIIL